MKNDLKTWTKILTAGLVAFVAILLLSPSAHADIFKTNGAVACPHTTQAVDSCPNNGSTPWQLSALITALEQPNILDSLGEGTDVFEVTGLSSSSFSFTLTSTGQPAGGNNDTMVANNAQCQITGASSSLFSSCSIVDSLGQTTSLGGAQINNITFPATITFGGFSGTSTSVFELDFVSMQGTSNIVGAPEPSSVTMLAAGLLGLVALVGLRKGQLV